MPSEQNAKDRDADVWNRYEHHRLRKWVVYVQLTATQNLSYIETPNGYTYYSNPFAGDAGSRLKPAIGLWMEDGIKKTPQSFNEYRRRLRTMGRKVRFMGSAHQPTWISDDYGEVTGTINDIVNAGSAATKTIGYRGNKPPRGLNGLSTEAPKIWAVCEPPAFPTSDVTIEKNQGDKMFEVAGKRKFGYEYALTVSTYAVWEHGTPRL